MRTLILGSGAGTNAKAIIQAQADDFLGKAEIIAVLSDNKESGILEIAKLHKIENLFLDPGLSLSKLDEKEEQTWIETIKSYEPDLIVLAGFMRILSPIFLKAFPRMIINLHPSLLPSFKGLNAIEQAYEYGVRISGSTVHWVNCEVDGGEIIAQAPVRIMLGDTLEMVREKIRGIEYMLLPSVIRDLSIGSVSFPE